jgi:membrane protein YqaA with SNARE-associated domain
LFQNDLTSALLSLAGSSFISATLLPGASEAVLVWVTHLHPQHLILAWGIASFSNTLGSMTSFALGWYFPGKYQLKISDKAQHCLNRWGSPVLLLSWLPIVGDALPLAAGWLRLPRIPSITYIFIGKAIRYAVILWASPIILSL